MYSTIIADVVVLTEKWTTTGNAEFSSLSVMCLGHNKFIMRKNWRVTILFNALSAFAAYKYDNYKL